MGNQQQYVTITHYKEREFYFLNHAIQTHDGFIPKEMEQFHESEKEKFIERINELQSKYSNVQIASISLEENQIVTDKEDKNKATAKIFKDNYVVQNSIDVGNTPTTLYFSPFAVLYEEYKNKLDSKLTLLIGLFNRKLYMMFATDDKIHQSWIIGTRGLTEKQVADRVYKSMKAYYKISYKFADHIEMLVTDDSPKLLKVLREELSLNILLTQNSIHNLLHHMGGEHKRTLSSFIHTSMPKIEEKRATPVEDGVERIGNSLARPSFDESLNSIEGESSQEGFSGNRSDFGEDNLQNLRLNGEESDSTDLSTTPSFMDKIKNLFKSEKSLEKNKAQGGVLLSLLPLLFVLASGGYFTFAKYQMSSKTEVKELQAYAQANNSLLAMTTTDVFSAMGKSAELKKATISNSKIELKGLVWGIEPLRNSLNSLYHNGDFSIKPLEDFRTEFSFKSKV